MCGSSAVPISVCKHLTPGPIWWNLDYTQIREGTTLYLPVYQAGALLTVGDGHAVQGDGEITGQGLEVSMDVEFTVDLVRDQLLDQPWAENDEFIMVSVSEAH